MDETPEDASLLEHHDSIESKRVLKSSVRWSSFNSMSYALMFLIILSNGVWWINYASTVAKPCIRPKLIYSPATQSISYKKVELFRSIEDGNIYTGEPREELDKAWSELIKPMAIKITAQELALLGKSSIAFNDGSGYLAEMAVFHELHCIKRIRRHLHIDYYYGNMTADEEDRERRHMDHCLEYWREAAMCRGDPTLATFVWNEGRPFSKVNSLHECVDWDGVRRWAESRMVDTSDLTIFSRPVSGGSI
ncbi:hypothetical protein EV127DRAFT_486944 [Xylaria flabelliformis]|nr:hypothetical protein EV127DRAFT_486944 [Xylaria flabelliformis]